MNIPFPEDADGADAPDADDIDATDDDGTDDDDALMSVAVCARSPLLSPTAPEL